MDPNEVEFLGEKQRVTIIPSFTFDQIHLISGSIGPFRAGLPTRVPIWLAVNLKQQQKCRIVKQEWMDVEQLIKAKEEEKLDKDSVNMHPKTVRNTIFHLEFFEAIFSQQKHPIIVKLIKEMPSDHYMDEALMLLGVASDDIPQADEIRTAIKDLWDLRMSKLRTSVDAFLKSDSTHAKLDHLTPMEINSVRPLLPHALDQLLRIQMSGNKSSDTQNSQHSQ